MYELIEYVADAPVIRVVGVGGAGCRVVGALHAAGLRGVETIGVDADPASLRALPPAGRVALDPGVLSTAALAAAPASAVHAALGHDTRLRALVAGSDLLLLVGAVSGAVGGSVMPALARLAAEQGVPSVALTAEPASFQAPRCHAAARIGSDALRAHADTVLELPTASLLMTLPRNTPLAEAFRPLDAAWQEGVRAVVGLITEPGLIGVDLGDVRAALHGAGRGAFGTGRADGADRAREAVQAALRSPSLKGAVARGAHGALVRIVCGLDVPLTEFEAVGQAVRESVGDGAVVVIGLCFDDTLPPDTLTVALVVTGLERSVGERRSRRIRQRRAVRGGDWLEGLLDLEPYRRARARHASVVTDEDTDEPPNAALVRTLQRSAAATDRLVCDSFAGTTSALTPARGPSSR